ncbi:MAG: gluconate 2-dehydrogenase subunit 3 family protein [Myxococcota bacterium]
MSRGVDRRTWVRGAAAAAAGTTLGGATWAWYQNTRAQAPGAPAFVPEVQPVLPDLERAFDPRATVALGALFPVLLPSREGLPGAAPARVFDYVERALRQGRLRPLRNELLKLARYLDRLSAPKRFADLDIARLTQILLEVQSDSARKGTFVPQRALEVALRLGLEGYLGHPHHGGNRAFVAWEALEIPMPRRRDSGAPRGHE